MVSRKTEWWRGAALYQIYPRSFADSNGDGIGDLEGITRKLEYVASLGVAGVWISPFFPSPMKDLGYDVSDYFGVDPIFGTLDDFDRLVKRAHELDLKVIIDQVYSHTSDQHAWFAESRSGAENDRADWYVWEKPKPDGSPPNNWLSVFGGPAWTWDARRRRYYLHNFLASQPDLNLHNPEVQDALLSVAKFWLDRGVDGFRLDAINLGMHDQALRDNPPAPCGDDEPGRPYFMQEHKFNLDHDDMPPFLERIRALANDYGEIMTVAEVGGSDPGPVQRAYTCGDARLSTAYALSFLGPDRPTVTALREAFVDWPADPQEGWPAWAFSNHDAPRVASRWADKSNGSAWPELFGLLLMSLRGNVFVYQGEELGLPQADVPFERLQDPEAIANWPETLGRDGARTPMPWQAGARHAGFSDAEPWLPVDARHFGLAVDAQEATPAGTLHAYRRFIKIRQSSAALRVGELRFLDAPDSVLAFVRETEDERATCVFNFGDQASRWRPAGIESARLQATVGVTETSAPSELPPLAAYIAFEALT